MPGQLAYIYDYADGVSYARLTVGNRATDVTVEVRPIEEALTESDPSKKRAAQEVAIMQALLRQWLAPA